MGFLDNLQSFIDSPEAGALAASLLKSSGPSQMPITLGQALGQGMQDMEAAKVQAMQNKMRQAELDKFNEETIERKAKNEARQQLIKLYGNAATPAQGIPYRNIEGTGYLGGQLSKQDFMAQAAPLLLTMGDEKTALGLLGGNSEYGQPVAGIDARGQPVYFQADKSGNIRPIDGIMPIPKKGMSFITNPDGTVEFSQGGYDLGNGAMSPTPKVTNDLQGDLIKADESLTRLDQVAEKFSSDYLTYPGQARNWIGSQLNKLTGKEVDKDFRTGMVQFKNSVDQTFNQYRKDITGAAAAQKELEQLRESIFNSKMDSVSFKAGYAQFRDMLDRIRYAKAHALAEGIKFGTKDYGRRVDELVLGGGTPQQTQAQAQQAQAPAQVAQQQPQVRRYNPATGKIE